MKKLLFLLIACLAITLSSCGSKADYKAINEKIENNEALTSEEISAVIDYVEEGDEILKKLTEDNTDHPEEVLVEFENKYEYLWGFAGFLLEMDDNGNLKGENKKRVKKLFEK